MLAADAYSKPSIKLYSYFDLKWFYANYVSLSLCFYQQLGIMFNPIVLIIVAFSASSLLSQKQYIKSLKCRIIYAYIIQYLTLDCSLAFPLSFLLQTAC